MSWQRFFREVDRGLAAMQRRARRSAVERHLELSRQAREREMARAEQERMARARDQRSKKEEQEAAKAAERQRAADEVELFANYLQVLTSIHRDLVLDTDWTAVASAPPPSPPVSSAEHEDAAIAALEGYSPGFWARLSGAAGRERRALERAVAVARAQDASAHQAAVALHRAQLADHAARVELSYRVLRQDPEGYRVAMESLAGLDDLVELGVDVGAAEVEPDAVALTCAVRDDEIVPPEDVKLSAAGKLTTKKWADSKYWGLYQDFVCGCALRLAREAMGLLPVSRVVVNVSTRMLNTSTGHIEPSTILGVHFTRPALAAINFAAVDASDSLANFNWRMKFKKTAGFEPVDPVTLADNWVE